MLWAIVFIRLICPVFPESRFSLIPETLVSEQAQQRVSKENANVVTAGTTKNESENLLLNGSGTDLSEKSNLDGSETDRNEESNLIEKQKSNLIENQGENTNTVGNKNRNNRDNNVTFTILSYIWFAGVIVLAVYHIASYWRFKIRIKKAKEVEKGIKEVKGEHLSFVFGIIHPTIYLSEGLDEQNRKVIQCHEGVHLSRKDYLIKPLALAISCIHWFNPFVWLAFYLMNKDCEMSCDEKVVNQMGEESKKIYSYALLNEATGGRGIMKNRTVGSLTSFGEDGVKSRIKHVLNYKKAPFWIILSAMGILILLVVCFLSNPKGEEFTKNSAIEAVRKAGGYDKDAKSVCFLKDYEGDKKEEAFVEIGKTEDVSEEGSMDGYLYGDLWFISEEGDTTLLLEDVYLKEEQETFESDNMKYLLVSYIEGNPILTNVYGVTDNKAVSKIPYGEEKHVAGDTIICAQSEYDLDYDIESDIFTGHTHKNYIFYYKDGNFVPYKGSDLSREEVADYENGEEILRTLEQENPDGRYQYIIIENNLLHINIASISEDSIRFSYKTYEINDNKLNLVEEGEGCYRKNINDEEEETFAKKISREYSQNNQSILGHVRYTGWLDECTAWSEYKSFINQDYDGDGKTDRVYHEYVSDGDEDNYRISFGNGDEITITGIGTGIPHIQGIDLTGDGVNEIITSFTYDTSTDPSAFGKNLIFEKIENGYERMKWPTVIENAMDKENQNSPKITLHYEKEKDSYHVTCLELAKEAPIDVVVDIDEEQMKQGYDYFDGEDFEYPMYVLKVVESKGELPYLVGTFATFDKWSTHDIQVTFAYNKGKLIIEKSSFVKRN